MLAFLEHFSVAASAIAGALAGRGRGVDLFGVVVLALVTAFGGGTIRDLCLAKPVFWIQDSSHVLTALAAALATFIIARRCEMPSALLGYADALGLALFAMMGTDKALSLGATSVAAVALGTITGVAGGILRDTLLNDLPAVFRREIRLYATAAILGAMLLVLLRIGMPDGWLPVVIGATTTFFIRLAAMRWEIALPVFEKKQ